MSDCRFAHMHVWIKNVGRKTTYTSMYLQYVSVVKYGFVFCSLNKLNIRVAVSWFHNFLYAQSFKRGKHLQVLSLQKKKFQGHK